MQWSAVIDFLWEILFSLPLLLLVIFQVQGKCLEKYNRCPLSHSSNAHL